MNLFLQSPLFFKKIKNLPSFLSNDQEFLLCYELNPVQSRSIEPLKEQLLGNLLFIGEKTDDTEQEEKVFLPAGQYLFEQCRKVSALNQEEWLDMAIEQQKDGLWERNKPGNLLYVRFLYEDGAFVTQVFRTV